MLAIGAGAAIGARPDELCVEREGRCVAGIVGAATPSDGAGDTSRERADLADSCIRPSSMGFTPRSSRPLPLTGVELGVPDIGETPRLDIGEAAPTGRVSGNEIVGFAFIFSLPPPNLNKPGRLGLRCDEVEVGREAGVEISLE